MITLNEMSDEEFVPFLHSLGVETYKRSFEWMLSDREFAGVLQWLYNNLDHNNALTAREECRYLELEKKSLVFTSEDIDNSISHIQEQYEGICLPGDKEAVEDVKLDIQLMKERLSMLEKQEIVYQDLKKQNQLLKEELNLELTKLNSAHQQFVEDETNTADECMSLAKEVESLTKGVIDVIADTLEVYSTCHVDKENAKKFFTFGPFESYRQSQALLKSHLDLFTSKNIAKIQNDTASNADLRSALIQASHMEERLSDAAWSYIDSNVELCGELAKLAYVTNYKEVHPSQITASLLEAQSSVELLEQEETILYEQLHSAVLQFVESRTALAVETTASRALAVRQQLQSALSEALEVCSVALRLDQVLYTVLRRELRTAEQFVQFAHELRQYVMEEGDAVRTRIEAMNDIYSEQTSRELKLKSSDILLQALYYIMNGQFLHGQTDTQLLFKQYFDLVNDVVQLKESVDEEFRNKEIDLVEFKCSTKPLQSAIFSGCTRQPLRSDITVSTLQHSLTQQLREVDGLVLTATNKFTSVKNGDKQHLRKLWQWFLTDPAKLLSTMKNANCKFYD